MKTKFVCIKIDSNQDRLKMLRFTYAGTLNDPPY